MIKILPITNSVNYARPRAAKTSFNSSSVLSDVVKIGKTISKNPKTSGFIAAGVLLAGALLYSASKLFENKKSEKNNPVKNLIKENPLRLEYIKMLGDYPTLSEKYYEFLSNSAKNPKDIIKKNLLGIFELILEKYREPEIFEKNRNLFESLENNYTDDLENLCLNFYVNAQNGGSIDRFLQLVKLNQISSDDLKRWTQYPKFDVKDILSAKLLPERAVQYLHKQKEQGNILGFKTDKKSDEESYFYSLMFPKKKPLKEKLKTVVEMHETLYGPIALKQDESKGAFQRYDIENELYDRLKKDKMLDSVYNLVKFLNPKALEEFNFTSDEVKTLPENSKKYRKLREALGRGIVSINLNSDRANELLSVINDNSIPKEILANGHATIRFISRFVLKNNFNPDLKKDTTEKIETFKQELEKRFNGFVKVAKYRHKRGFAPYFYLGENSLGEFIKITLNNAGQIHTLFESTQKYREFYGIH